MDKEKDINEAAAQQKPAEQPDPVVIDDVDPTLAQDEIAEEVAAESADQALSDEQKLQQEVDELKAQVETDKKNYLLLMAEFDNFRKRTLKEKSELIKNAGESVFKGLLPIVDDFERALKATENSDDAKSMREGLELIYKKLIKFMAQNGVKEMNPEDRDFDTERHESISVVPVPDDDQKGKILDTVEKGYHINDKVLRHAKVVVGQ